ncbi:hypothetical protein [Microbulbifer aestuariivivens]|uniref:hypothetical protein n=1 Tax=Microbulbifer aestuariivivens TaxID=1908308 RepID=UPI0031F1A371
MAGLDSLRCASAAPASGVRRKMGTTTELRKEIKKTFIPYVEAKGFISSMENAPNFFDFKKIIENEEWFFDIQFEKYGTPRFVVNFGKAQIKNNKRTITTGHCRLQPGKTASTGSWFRQDKHWIIKLLSSKKLHQPEVVVEQLISLFPEIEQYFQDGTIGEHLRVF